MLINLLIMKRALPVLSFAVVSLVAISVLAGCSDNKGESGATEGEASNSASIAIETAASDSSAVTDSAGSVATDAGSVIDSVGDSVATSDAAAGAVSLPKIPSVGSSSVTLLNRSEACGLVSADLLASTYKLKSKPANAGWSQSDDETLCEVIAIDEPDGAAPHFAWYVSAKGKDGWATEPNEGTKITPTTIDGKEATIVSKPGPGLDTSSLIYVLIDPAHSIWFEANGWDGASDIAGAQKIVGALANSVSTLKPTVEPPVDAKVKSALEMTAGQLCSLVREPATAALLAGSPAGGFDSFLLQGDAIQCSKGGAKLNVTISSREPFVLDEKFITKVKIDGLDGMFEKPPIVDGEGLQYMSLTVPQGPIWITMQAGLVPDKPEVENVLKGEMSWVLSELKKRVG